MASQQSVQRPGLSQHGQRTISTVQPTTTRASNFAPQQSYSLAGPRDIQPRQPARHQTFVDEGYRDLNPEYEREVQDPVFSLGGNLPHTVRGFMKRRGSKNGKVGVSREEKGEREAAPQLQNTDDKANRTAEQEKTGSNEPPTSEAPTTPSGSIGMRTVRARTADGQDLGTIGEEPYFSQTGQQQQSDDERTLTAEEAEVQNKPFNPWAGFRRKYQDPLGEWLGTTVLIAIGVASNLQTTTSQQQAGTYSTMCFAWGFATMISVYISGGSSGAHLNPALSIMLCVWRGFPVRRVPVYIAAQLLGAFTGALIAIALYRDNILHFDGAFIPASTGTAIYTQPKDWVRPATAFFTEAFGTGLLSCGIIALGDDANSPPGAGMHAFIIGLLVTTLLMAFGYNTGAAFNPVRDLGPRLAALVFGYPTSIFNAGNAWWIWGCWGATITGSLLGVGVYDICIFKGGESPVNYSTQKWKTEGKKAEVSWFQTIGNRGRANDIAQELEKGEV